jgi:hypothetical protein
MTDVLRGGPMDGLRLVIPAGTTSINFPTAENGLGLVTYVPHPSKDHVWVCAAKAYKETATLKPEETS